MKAQCQCGCVTLEVSHNHQVHACHCSKCRQRASGASFVVTAEGKPHISGSEHIGSYHSSDWAECTFCKQCGTQLYFHLLPESGMDEAWYVNAGLPTTPISPSHCKCLPIAKPRITTWQTTPLSSPSSSF